MGQKQHYVPESYLRQFTDSDGYFFQATIKSANAYERPTIKKVNTGQVCYLPDFYDLKSFDIRSSHLTNGNSKFLETKGFPYEGDLAKYLSIFKKRNQFMFKKKLDFLINAYLSIKQRNFYIRDEFLGDNTRMSEIIDGAIKATLHDPLTEFFIQKSGFNFSITAEKFKLDQLSDPNRAEKSHLDMLISTRHSQNDSFAEIQNELILKHFVILEAGDNDYFIISDNPGYTLKQWKDKLGVYNTDFKNFHQVIFPINSKQVLLINNNQSNQNNLIYPLRKINYYKINPEWIHEINVCSTYCVNSKIFCENKTYLNSFMEKLKI